jgi:putative membrane protein
MELLVRILANSGAIFLADRFVPGFVFRGTTLDLFIAGVVLGIINALVRPVLKFISFPIIFLTLGLFSVVINIFLLFLAARFLPTLRIDGITAAFWGVVIISLMNNLVTHLKNSEK